MRGGWARHALERYSILKNWRRHVGFITEACKDVLGNECLHVYVVGGVAEGRITVLSDIDVVITVNDPGLKSIDTVLSVKRRARELGLEDDVPIDLKILEEKEFQELVKRGVYRRVVKLK
ncbi:nucleotidyltransferase domain-containing protein [Stetteria hydrogenophila]